MSEVEVSGQIYYSAIDLVCAAINNRFYQPGMKIYTYIESLLCGGGNEDEARASLTAMYEITQTDLTNQLSILRRDDSLNSHQSFFD